MESLKKYESSFRVEMYPCKYIFFFNYTDIHEVIRLLPKHIKKKYKHCVSDLSKQISEYDFNSTDGQVFYSDGYILSIISNYNDSNPFQRGRLAHEIGHVVYVTAKHIGMKYCEESEEFFTYLQGHLTEKIYKKIM